MDSLNLLSESLQYFKTEIQHVLVKNWGRCDDWEAFHQDDYLQGMIKDYAVKVIDFPKFVGNADRNNIDAKSMTLPKRRAWTWKDRVLVGGMAIAIAIVSFLYVEQRQVSQRVQWLLEKANRQDCLTGIKKLNSPECKGL